MTKIILGITLLFIIPLSSYSKGIKIQLQGGLGSYSMSDMKTLDKMIAGQLPLSLHQTDNFPAYWFYQGAVLFNLSENLSMGPMYAFHSTGSRYSLADYSGEYFYDNLLRAHSPGLTINYTKAVGSNFKCGAYIDGGISFTKAEFKEHLQLSNLEEEYNESSSAKETSYFIEPGFLISYPLKKIEPGLHIGYYIPVAAGGFKENESGQLLYLSSENKAKSGWGGLRVGISLSF